MGNSSSSSSRAHHDESVDYGAFVPQGVYTGPRDWNQAIVSQLIASRRLAPFYRPLEEYEDSWDDDQILAARKDFPDSDHPESVTRTEHPQTSQRARRPGSLKEPARPEAQIYRGAVECPICFLYYPANINRSRCCDHPICTECFVQIKRSEPTTTHIVSEPAACPYCVQENFGIIYSPPPWRAGLGGEHGGISPDLQRCRSPTGSTPPPSHKRRQKSFGADSPEVVLTDHIRPDWETKLEAVRAAVARRANRRIVMRQVGDRLVPVGVTSGRVHALSPEEVAAAAASVENGSRRGRRHRAGGDALEQLMGMTGPDIEELMLMEAMRLSMLDHEVQQRKEAEEKRKHAAVGGSVAAPASANSSGGIGANSLSVLSSSSRGRTSPIGQTSKNSRSISRSRTPSPSNPVLPSSAENQPTWRSRTDGLRQFSMLRAVLPTTSTGAAVLGTSNPIGMSTPQAGVDALASSAEDSSSIPTITIAQDSIERNHSTEVDRSSMYSDAPLPPLPVDAVPSTSSTSTDEQSTSETTSTSSSFGPLETGIGMSTHTAGSGNLGSSPGRTPLLNSGVGGLRKPFVKETHVEDVSR